MPLRYLIKLTKNYSLEFLIVCLPNVVLQGSVSNGTFHNCNLNFKSSFPGSGTEEVVIFLVLLVCFLPFCRWDFSDTNFSMWFIHLALFSKGWLLVSSLIRVIQLRKRFSTFFALIAERKIKLDRYNCFIKISRERQHSFVVLKIVSNRHQYLMVFTV